MPCFCFHLLYTIGLSLVDLPMVPIFSIILLIVVLKAMDANPVLGVFIGAIGLLFLVELTKKSKTNWTDTLADFGVLSMFICAGIGIFQVAYSLL